MPEALKRLVSFWRRASFEENPLGVVAFATRQNNREWTKLPGGYFFNETFSQ
jgi:hypothetical protein